jgi:FKBP-type peptidyl-prolyl cis-trans isomerase
MSLRPLIPHALTALAVAALACQPAQSPSEPPSIESDQDKAFYALGFRLAEGMAGFGMKPDEVELFMLGIRDFLAEEPARVADTVRYVRMAQDIEKQRSAERTAREREEAARYMDQMAAEAGAVRLESGVVFLGIAEGTGPQPTAASEVTVHYHGTLRTGRVFDSSRDRGETASFPLDRVIPCWTEAIPMIRVGGKAKISCPPDQAYGDRQAGLIPPGAAITFEVELIGVN